MYFWDGDLSEGSTCCMYCNEGSRAYNAKEMQSARSFEKCIQA
jgi:hypothetical protein